MYSRARLSEQLPKFLILEDPLGCYINKVGLLSSRPASASASPLFLFFAFLRRNSVGGGRFPSPVLLEQQLCLVDGVLQTRWFFFEIVSLPAFACRVIQRTSLCF